MEQRALKVSKLPCAMCYPVHFEEQALIFVDSPAPTAGSGERASRQPHKAEPGRVSTKLPTSTSMTCAKSSDVVEVHLYSDSAQLPRLWEA